MFRRSRKKIIVSIMGSLILLFAVTLSVIMLASSREMRRQNTEMLERYVEQYSPDQQGRQEEPEPVPYGQSEQGSGRPDQGKPPRDEKRDFQLSTFYSVAFAEDGTVLAIDTGERTIYSEEELTLIAEEILAGDSSSGRRDNLSYVVSNRSDYTLVAFMDTTVTESSLTMLLHNILIIGGAAIVILFFIALILSKQIIRPLEENDRQQKQFVSDASHELKTPVAVIGANAEMLQRELGENEWLANIRYENERMGGLVRQLLDLSRAENTEAPTEQIDLSRVLTGEVLALESLAFDQGKSIRSDIGEGIHVSGSRTQLTQLISVLLDNAIRHSTGNEIEVSLGSHGRMAVLSVANEGDEIPPEKQAHLFDRFYRADEARTGEGQHYGLGLSIAQAVAEKHGGSIAVSCRDGRVIFTVSIPEKK